MLLQQNTTVFHSRGFSFLFSVMRQFLVPFCHPAVGWNQRLTQTSSPTENIQLPGRHGVGQNIALCSAASSCQRPFVRIFLMSCQDPTGLVRAHLVGFLQVWSGPIKLDFCRSGQGSFDWICTGLVSTKLAQRRRKERRKEGRDLACSGRKGLHHHRNMKVLSDSDGLLLWLCYSAH